MQTEPNFPHPADSSFDYLRDRLENQIDWYSQKASDAKKWHISLSVVVFTAAAVIPCLPSILPDESMKVVAGVIGVAISIATGLSNLLKCHEKWVEYRATSESLKHEKFLFLQKCAPYDNPNGLKLLAERVESMISRENTNWQQSNINTKETK